MTNPRAHHLSITGITVWANAWLSATLHLDEQPCYLDSTLHALFAFLSDPALTKNRCIGRGR